MGRKDRGNGKQEKLPGTEPKKRGNCPATGYTSDHNMVRSGHNLECANRCGYGYPVD